nr:MAG TPA: hypothetical protein [Caudoviricetes sp.]
MPNITKAAVRDFVRSEYLKRYEPLKNAREEALRSAIESSHLFIDFKNIMASAESVASALEKAGYGSTFRRSLDSCDVMLARTINNLWTKNIDSPKDEIKLLYTVAKPYDEKLEKLENAYKSARRVIDAAPGGKAAADTLKLSGIDFYEWQNTDREATLDLSALKGGD